MGTCSNPECRVPVNSENRSRENTAFCQECGKFVYAFRPNSHFADDWYFVSESTPKAGIELDGDQCEGCGLNVYTIEADGRHAFAAVCAGQAIEGDFHKGCGTRHPVRRKMAKDTIF